MLAIIMYTVGTLWDNHVLPGPEGGKELPFLERHPTRITTRIRIPQNKSMMRIGIILIMSIGNVGVALEVPKGHNYNNSASVELA